MSSKMLALLGLSLLLLAGCSAKPPSGTLAPVSYSLSGVDGTATITYTPFSSGGNPTGPVPVVGPTAQCSQDGIVSMIPGYPQQSPLQKCTPASTRVLISAKLPAQGSASYTAYFVGGSAGEQVIGDLAASPDGALVVNKTFDVDLTGQHTGVEVRLQGFVAATTPTAGGPLAPANVGGIAATGTFEGPKLTLTVSGLPENGTYIGRLYTKDAAGVLAVRESFSLKNGATSYTAKQDIAQFAEFHIHVGDSLLNLYKATVKPDA
jgi:hypothetical protein